MQARDKSPGAYWWYRAEPVLNPVAHKQIICCAMLIPVAVGRIKPDYQTVHVLRVAHFQVETYRENAKPCAFLDLA